MASREELYEQYDDALFQYLMDSVIQHQGEEYQEELQQLREQENVGPSEEVSRRCLRLIRRELRRRKLRAVGRQAVKVAGKAAVVLLVAVSCLTAAFALSPGFRSSALRWMVGTFGDHAEYRFNQTEEGALCRKIEVGWLPEGYELVESNATNRTVSQVYVELSNGVEQRIKIQVMNFSGKGIFKIDTEADQVYQVSVKNTLATVIQRDGSVQLTWMYPESNFIIMLYGDNISAEIALRIAQDIVLS